MGSPTWLSISSFHLENDLPDAYYVPGSMYTVVKISGVAQVKSHLGEAELRGMNKSPLIFSGSIQ